MRSLRNFAVISISMQKLKLLLTVIILINVIFFSLSAITHAVNAMDLQSTMKQENNVDTLLLNPAQEKTAPASRVSSESDLHMEFGVQYIRYRNMDEPYQFNPAAELMPASSPGWEHTWQEERTWLRAGYDLFNSKHLLLQPGLMLGAVRGEFKASNAALHFSEEWRTKSALLWGLSFTGELRADRHSGPFLNVRYMISGAEASEEHETLTSDNLGTSGEMRDARFRWQETEAFLGAGYRWGTLKPMAGISYTNFRLQKRLRYHIPEAGLSSTDLQVVRALNSRESEYDFRNGHPWAPFLALEWTMTPGWTLVAVFTFRQNEDLSLSLRKNF